MRRWRATRGFTSIEVVAQDRQAARRAAVLALAGVVGDLIVEPIEPTGDAR